MQIRCYTCGKLLLNLNLDNLTLEKWKEICLKYNIIKLCCKNSYLTRIDVE